MFKLPNGKPIDAEMLDIALSTTDESTAYLNIETGAIVYFTDDEEIEAQQNQGVTLDDVIGNDSYVLIEPISSRESYSWMEDFINEIVEPRDTQAAEKLSIAIRGKGAFRRFKDVLRMVDEQWLKAWYTWEEEQRNKSIQQWIDDVATQNA